MHVRRHNLAELDPDLSVIEQLVWVDLPQSYGFRTDYTYVGNGVSLSFQLRETSDKHSPVILMKLIEG